MNGVSMAVSVRMATHARIWTHAMLDNARAYTPRVWRAVTVNETRIARWLRTVVLAKCSVYRGDVHYPPTVCLVPHWGCLLVKWRNAIRTREVVPYNPPWMTRFARTETSAPLMIVAKTATVSPVKTVVAVSMLWIVLRIKMTTCATVFWRVWIVCVPSLREARLFANPALSRVFDPCANPLRDCV